MIKPDISIKTLDHQPILYIRFRGTYAAFRKKARSMFNELFKHAQDHELIDPNYTKILTVYHDNPFITDESNLRTSIAMTLPQDVEAIENETICKGSLDGKFLVGRFDLAGKDYGEAWKHMYQTYILNGVYTPRDAVPFELYVSEPPRNLKETSITEIYIPIV